MRIHKNLDTYKKLMSCLWDRLLEQHRTGAGAGMSLSVYTAFSCFDLFLKRASSKITPFSLPDHKVRKNVDCPEAPVHPNGDPL